MINNNLHSTKDVTEEYLKLFPPSPLQPRSATTFSPAAVDKVLQGINGTLFTDASSSCNMAPLPSAPARIYCLPCLLHDQGLNGYIVCSYQQNHGPKCQKFIIPFYGFYCNYLLDNNKTAPPFGDIPLEYKHLMELPRNEEVATDLTVGSVIGNGPVPTQLSDNFYSKLSLNVNKLIKAFIQEELTSLSLAVAPLPVVLEDDLDNNNDTLLEQLQAIDISEPILTPIGTRSNSTAPLLSYKF